MEKKMLFTRAAEIMGKSEQFVWRGLITGKLPFGTAVKIKGKYNYHISPRLFMDYTGCIVEKLRSD